MRMLRQTNPIFIVGMNGSGTTMMLDCLNGHPDLYGFRRETQVIPRYIETLSNYGDLNNDENFLRLWDEFRQLSHFIDVNNGTSPPLPENWRELPRTFSTIINETFGYFSSKENKSRWCEKTPMHALHITKISELLPNAQFIHMIRDGRACAASFHRRWKYTPELTLYRWKNVVQEARQQGALIRNNYMEVRYEKLTESPQEQMERVCAFLLVPFSKSVLAPSRTRTFTGSTNNKITQNKETWPYYFNASELKKLEKIGGKMLFKLGYSTNSPESDVTPPLILRKLWLYRDYIRYGLKLMLKDIQKGDKQMFIYNVRKIKNAIIQRLTTKY